MAEITALRTRHAKVYDTEDPRRNRAVISAGPVHFKNRWTGEWDDVENLIDANGFTQGEDVQFGVIDGYSTAQRGARSLGFRPSAIGLVDTASGQWRQIATANFSNASRDGAVWTITSVFPGVDLIVELREQSMSKRFVLASRPNLPDPATFGMNPDTTYLVIAYDVDNQTGVGAPTIEKTGQPFAVGSSVHSDLVYVDGQGEEVFRLRAGACGSDASGAERDVLYVRRTGLPFGEAVPYRWVDEATYPCWIDPTTTIYTGTEDGQINELGTVITTNTTAWIGWKQVGAPAYDTRYYARFNLSSLSGYVCNSATVNLWCGAVSGSTPRPVQAKLYTTDWGPTLSYPADWNQAGSDQDGTKDPTANSWVTSTCTPADIEAKFGSYASFEWRPTKANPGSDSYITVICKEHIANWAWPYISITYTTVVIHALTSTGAAQADATTAGAVHWSLASTGAARADATTTGEVIAFVKPKIPLFASVTSKTYRSGVTTLRREASIAPTVYIADISEA